MSMKKAMLIDLTLCVGCNACQTACKEANKLPVEEEKNLSPTAFTALEEHNGIFVRRMCQHCDDPACVSVCPVGAFEKTAEGPVLYDAEKCIGCRYCMQACPFKIPRYEWSSTSPRVRKCVFCHERLSKGLPTACSQACPTGATLFGDREELLKTAHERLSAEPEKYVQKIYGQHEAGGTSIFYISSTPFEKLGFNTTVGNEALPALTWKALEKVPSVLSIGSVMLAGVWWITNRRMMVQEYEQRTHGETKEELQ